MVYDWIEDRPLNLADPRNGGLLHDRVVKTREGHTLRLIGYVADGAGGGPCGVEPVAVTPRRAATRSVKFVRWLRDALHFRLTEAAAVPRLESRYAAL